MSKCIANRIKKILHNIIHYDQTGFLQGRYIGENIIKILALLDYCAQNEVNGYLITVDFEKAFDYLEHSHIHRCLKYFGFGPKIQNWISVLYNDAQRCVINNGWFSSFLSYIGESDKDVPFHLIYLYYLLNVWHTQYVVTQLFKELWLEESNIKCHNMLTTPLSPLLTILNQITKNVKNI